MRLHSVRLQNFRQHVNTQITFADGLTGIIGPNGSGKTTILEAIAWALYGNSAARGTRDSVRNSRAETRAPVKVELAFELAGHAYRVVRGLTSAECFLDGAEQPIATTITGVTDLIQRRLGMTRAEFFHTYFTWQKELDVMAGLGPTERARFLSRVLGYDRLSGAQELAREKRRALMAEINGLKQGMPDADATWRMLSEAEARLAVARARAVDAEGAQSTTAATLSQIAPQWIAMQTERDHAQQRLAELRVAENEALALGRDVERLEREVADIAIAKNALTPLQQQLLPLVAQRAQLSVLDGLGAAEARRQTLLERLRGLADEEARLRDRRTKLETAPALELETQQHLAAARATFETAEHTLESERTSWVRDRQEAETRLDALRTQYSDLTQQRETLEGLGEESPCPTCGRPLGASFNGVLELLVEQVETVRIDGNYYRQRVEQLSRPPEIVQTLEEQRRSAHADVATVERRLTRIQAGIAELTSLDQTNTAVVARIEEARKALADLPMGYDPDQHAALRDDVARLVEVEKQAARLSVLVERESTVSTEWQRVVALQGAARQRVVSMDVPQQTTEEADAEFGRVRDAHERAQADARRAELEAVAALADADRARSEMEVAEKGRRELARLEARLEVLDTEKRTHDELDRALTDLRTDLNFQLRPELAEIASRFLDTLTDGRYNALEFDEDYSLIVLEDGLPKPVISGGEEDLCNLVLRLAISQMIAERAGQAFSLLILDEVFGSLDDTRRGNVMELLRRLHDRFEQVIVITHIEHIREGLDRVLVVRVDEESGTSTVVPAVGAYGAHHTDALDSGDYALAGGAVTS